MDLSTALQPVAKLLEKDRAGTRGPSLAKVKMILKSAPTLAYFDPEKAATVNTDSGSYGRGVVLLQEHPDGFRPVAFAPRALTKGKRMYAQMEKSV